MRTGLPPVVTEEIPLRVEPGEVLSTAHFRLTDQAEIKQILSRLLQERELATIFFGDADRFAPAVPLALGSKYLILDIPAELLHDDILAANPAVLVASLKKVKLQFEVLHPHIVDWQGVEALAIAVPSEILRLQRRECYRLSLPPDQTISCVLPASGHGDEAEIPLMDISISGIGILGYMPGIDLSRGSRHIGARIELPDTGTIVADIEIRSVFDVTLKNGIRTTRIGAEFHNLPSSMQTLIQRYINRIEHLS